HAGIYVTSTTILHTSGRKSEPYPRYISEGNWHKRYASSKVIRPTSSTRGKKAAAMAKKYFYGKRIPYAITPGLLNIKKTYCSELVFYSYYKTGSPFIQMDKGAQLISPYAFLNSFAVKHNGFKFVDNKW
ncbi:hypothetical protein, partial [Macrococcoides caseolyticum]|uniref:hypothetical protein n=1 Tax=Macrococcoides caseolyticum TaxID=69966 RepID=UPI001F4571C1